MNGRPLPDRIEALVWSVENRMGTHDDVLALDAIKLEAETLEAEIADREAQYQALNKWAVEAEAERDCLRAKVERLERERDEWKATASNGHYDQYAVRPKPCDCLDCRAALEGREP